VLIVDDSEPTLKLLEHMTAKLPDAEPILFQDPTAALAWCDVQLPDMVLVDYMMPEIDGLEFITRFRRLPDTEAVPIVMVTSSEQVDIRYRAFSIGANDFLNKPVDPIELQARLKNLLQLRQSQRKLKSRAAWLAEEVSKQTEMLAEREKEIIWRLARAAEHRDLETGYHIQRVASYSRLIARRLGRSSEEQDLIYLAAPMHDIGKVGIPDQILLKRGRLDAAERRLMERHTVIGHAILSDGASELIQMAALIALSHHERFDGSGYPNGLSGEDIPLCGRIIAVADVFDALSTERSYKPAWSVAATVADLKAESGSHFDPQCLQAFLDRIDDVDEIMDQYQDELMYPQPGNPTS
jgi:putative two-component system response regulator